MSRRLERGSQVPGAVHKKRRLSPSFFIGLLAAGIVAGTLLSIATGSANISLQTVLDAFVRYDAGSVQHYTVLSVRLPRAILALLVGGSLAAAGAIMQGMTRNPLASPSIMGVSAGSSFAVVAAFAFWPFLSYHQVIAVSLAGAAAATLLVYGAGTLASLSSAGPRAHVKLALAGAAVSALLGAMSHGIQLYYGLAQDVMLWYAAGLAGVKWVDVVTVLPWVCSGLAAAGFLSGSITLLALGEDVAAGLGQRVKRVKLLGALTVFVLTGAAVAVAGPIGFIGLIIPHLTRFLIGVDYRIVIPCSALLGGWLLLMADTVSRMVNPPQETPVGIITALLGVPFFLYLARKEGRGSL
ncbi:FecCD family ABC transporter permease [Paenibacillus sp. y28]|uniref:FecCD family ABC transporter permease n=1 Tax=Paenibacillus sp. y28 TaxID=3129110 RepID=UPI0030173608